MIAPPVNIVSPFRGRVTTPLGAALTNVTFRKYPVNNVEGLIVPKIHSTHGLSAEGWYQNNKIGDLELDKMVMERIITAKLQQYPNLVNQITRNGGTDWLETCSHIVNMGPSRWEGEGRSSEFINVLIEAYENCMED